MGVSVAPESEKKKKRKKEKKKKKETFEMVTIWSIYPDCIFVKGGSIEVEEGSRHISLVAISCEQPYQRDEEPIASDTT